MQSVIDRLELKGTYESVGGCAFGAVTHTTHGKYTEMLAYYTRLPTVGDKTKANPYRHIRLHMSGRFYRTFEQYIQKGGTYSWVYDGFDNSPIPMEHVIRGVGIDPVSNALSLRPPVSTRERLDNRLLQKLSQQKYSLGESLGEVAETSAFIVAKSEHLMRVLVDLKRGHLSDALKQLGIRQSYMRKDVAHRWLEAQFAIKPLIGEIQQAIELAHEGLSTRATLAVKACVKHTQQELCKSHDAPAFTESKWTSRATCTAEVELSALRAAMQLGLGNPVSILWNILPLSWLVDYVANVGEIIDGLGATYGLTFVTGCYSDKLVGSARVLENTKRYGNPRCTVSYTGVSDCEGFQRTPFYSFPLPHVRFKFPLNATQLANAAALARVFLIGLRS